MVAELMASNSVIETSQKNSLVQDKHLQNSSTLGHRLDRLNDQGREQNQFPQILLCSAGDQVSSMDESDQIYYQKSNGKPSVSSSRQQLYPLAKLCHFPQKSTVSARSASASEWPFQTTALYEKEESCKVKGALYLTKTEKELLKLFDVV